MGITAYARGLDSHIDLVRTRLNRVPDIALLRVKVDYLWIGVKVDLWLALPLTRL